MTVLFRCRVEPRLLRAAKRISAELGTYVGEIVRLFMSQIARTGRVPLSLDAGDGLVDVKRRNELWSNLDDSTAKDWLLISDWPAR